MRVIEPNTHSNKELDDSQLDEKKKLKFLKPSLIFLLLAVLGAVAFWVMTHKTPAPSLAKNSKNQVAPKNIISTKASTTKTKLKTFTAAEFLALYDRIYPTYPNTEPITERFYITGNQKADARIQSLAEGRGYKLRRVPVAPIVKIGDPYLSEDDLLQQKALDAWGELQAAAKNDGLTLRIVSGYRSPDFQRRLFLSRLSSYSVSFEQIAAGQADNSIIDLLKTTSIPGYSKHHTGYTFDLQCDSGALEAFEASLCYTWISKNNYQNAKKAGFIPSYPAGGELQGPDPEPWEYVWVGKDAVSE